MDKLAEKQYKLDIDRNQMKKLSFRYDHDIEDKKLNKLDMAGIN